MTNQAIIAWLLDGDVSLQFQTHRDLLHEDRPDLQARIATEGWGARFLAARNANGSWGRGFYQPKWISTHYTLLDLRNLAIAPHQPEILESIVHILTHHRGTDGGVNPARSIEESDVCVTGMALNYASYFGAPPELLHSVVDYILGEQMVDGGFNCARHRPGARHSSLHSTISVLEGILEYARQGYTYRAGELRQITAAAQEFILQHRLYKSDHTGAVISPRFLMLSYPSRWFYDILRALDYFRAAGVGYDARMQDALAVLESKQRKDGAWPLQARHAGQTHFEMETTGQPSRWNTLRALRVLKIYGLHQGLLHGIMKTSVEPSSGDKGGSFMLAYFTQQSLMSNPGRYAHAFDALPTTVAELVRVVQGVTIHVFWAERYGLKLPPERRDEVQLRTLEKRLERTLELDPRPLTEARPPESRLVGNCRDFSLLLVALLRHQGIPARARCGFGAYFLPNHFEDHWVAEYWNAAQQRWVLVDAQLDDLQCEALHIAFDPLDTPRDQFIVGGQAWRMCRSGQANPDHFGIFDMHGLWFVRGDFVRDVAALNKMELLPWDCWGLINGDDAALTDHDWALLDRLADLTCGEVPEFATVRGLYEAEPGLRVGDEIESYIDGRAEIVRLTI